MTATEPGIDWAWYNPNDSDPSWRFAARYLTGDGNSKDLTLAEAQRLTAAGKDIIVVFETSGTDFTGGFAQGAADARAALAQASACGMPAGRPIYFAIDTQTTGQSTAAYFQGVNSVLGVAATGVYGSYDVCYYLKQAGLVSWTWQTLAWSGGKLLSGTNVYQSDNGANFDDDIGYGADFGQWHIGWTPSNIPVTPASPLMKVGEDVILEAGSNKVFTASLRNPDSFVEVNADPGGIEPNVGDRVRIRAGHGDLRPAGGRGPQWNEFPGSGPFPNETDDTIGLIAGSGIEVNRSHCADAQGPWMVSVRNEGPVDVTCIAVI